MSDKLAKKEEKIHLNSEDLDKRCKEEGALNIPGGGVMVSPSLMSFMIGSVVQNFIDAQGINLLTLKKLVKHVSTNNRELKGAWWEFMERHLPS